MAVLVTGGTSSIGKVLVRQLSEAGEQVRLLMRPGSSRQYLELPGVSFVPGDVTDAESVKRAMDGCSTVFHLASVVGEARSLEVWDQVNVEGSRSVFKAAYELGVGSTVFISSIGALGWTEPGEVGNEDRPRSPKYWAGEYGRTKNAAEEILSEYAAKGLRACTVYPGFGYGPSKAQSHPGLTDNTLLRMASGRPMPTLVGSNHLVISYFADTARGCRLAAEKGRPGEGYILGGENLTFQEIIAGAAAALGRPAPRMRVPLAFLRGVAAATRLLSGKSFLPQEFLDMVQHSWVYSSAKAERELGWGFTPYRQGMVETWRDWQAIGWKPGA